jgi:hypothetical protein
VTVSAPTVVRRDAAEGQPAHPDQRLHHLIDFGTALDAIAGAFSARMDEFDRVDGAGPDKFLTLGAHVYDSMAWTLDRYLTSERGRLRAENQNVLRSFSADLKRLAAGKHAYINRPWPDFWADGRKISRDLSAHVAHLGSMRKW